MKTLSCKRKFCHRPIEVRFEEVLDKVPYFDLPSWENFIACNRCADFYESKRKITDRVASESKRLQDARHGAVARSKLPEVEAAIAGNLERLTKDFALLVARYLRIGNAWSMEFVDMIMEKPTSCKIILAEFFKNCRKNQDKLQPEPTTNEPPTQMPLR